MINWQVKSNDFSTIKSLPLLSRLPEVEKGKSKYSPSATVVAFWAVCSPEEGKKIIIVTLSEMIRRT